MTFSRFQSPFLTTSRLEAAFENQASCHAPEAQVLLSHHCSLPGHVVGGRALLSDWDHLVVKGRRSQIKGTGLFLSWIFLSYANSGEMLC